MAWVQIHTATTHILELRIELSYPGMDQMKPLEITADNVVA